MTRSRDTADQINRINSSAANATAITVDSSENVTLTGALDVTGTATMGDVAITSGGTLDIFNSGNASTTLTALFGADNGAGNGRTNNTNKTTVLGMPHYTNAEEPSALIVAGSLSSSTFVTIGGGASVANAATYVSFNTAANTTTTGGTERMRIDSSGNLLVGHTSQDSPVDNGGTGVTLRPQGVLLVGGTGTTIYANRENSDGEIVQFRKDGTTVGGIGAAGNGSELFIAGSGANTSGIYFNGANQTLPMKAGSLSNATQDLGKSNFKWKDLYLSGGVFLGAHYEANRLHTYEEGDFQLSVAGRSGGAFGNGKYTKIGRTVTWQWYSAGQFTVTTATASFSGLPFGAIGGSYYSGFIAYHNTYTSGSKGGYIGGGSTSGYFTDNNTGSVAALTGTGKYLMISGTYLTS